MKVKDLIELLSNKDQFPDHYNIRFMLDGEDVYFKGMESIFKVATAKCDIGMWDTSHTVLDLKSNYFEVEKKPIELNEETLERAFRRLERYETLYES